MMFYLPPKTQTFYKGGATLKSDTMAEWIDEMWLPTHVSDDPVTLWATDETVNANAIARIDRAKSFDGWTFIRCEAYPCNVVNTISQYFYQGIGVREGAFVLTFADAAGATLEVFVAATHINEDACMIALAAVPRRFLAGWTRFSADAQRLACARDDEDYVVVVGGSQDMFVPTVEWDDIILPAALKAALADDITSFFTKGVDVYTRLNLKPFRKLLFAGVPGTGKTMLCNALAKRALAAGYLVIYVSSAQKWQGEQTGASFWKVERALTIAAYSERPTIILLEEMDAYLHGEEKALILNVLDGAETPMNPKGTLLIGTTNYPEAIDERVMKRPGRLDRIYVIPKVNAEDDAEAILRHYIGALWQPEHIDIAEQLVGYPGAFIRELAIHALTRVAYDDLPMLTRDMLQTSLDAMKAQLEARDALMAANQTTATPAEAPEPELA